MSHLHTIKVRGFHCDLYGHVNNARYLEFLEEARWAYLDGPPALTEMERRGLGFVVAAVTIEYKRPVGLGEVVEIRTDLAEVSAKRAVMRQQVFNQASGKLVADARVTFAIIEMKTGRAVVLTGEMHDWLRRADATEGPA
jgi:thioesterase-3